MLPKKLVIILIVVVAALVAAVFLVGSWVLNLSAEKNNPAGPSEYSAVYLTTGDIYFGKMDWFPWPHLKNVWFLQRTAGPNGQSQLGLAPFGNAFWGPVDEVYLNLRQVILWTRLRNDSQVAKAFANPQALQQQQPPPQPQPQLPPDANLQGPTNPPPPAPQAPPSPRK